MLVPIYYQKHTESRNFESGSQHSLILEGERGGALLFLPYPGHVWNTVNPRPLPSARSSAHQHKSLHRLISSLAAVGLSEHQLRDSVPWERPLLMLRRAAAGSHGHEGRSLSMRATTATRLRPCPSTLDPYVPAFKNLSHVVTVHTSLLKGQGTLGTDCSEGWRVMPP